MKKILTLLTVFSFALLGLAQESPTSGIITYEKARKLEIKMQGNENSEFASMLPKERKSQKELIFNQNLSLFRNIVKDDAEDDVVQESAGGATVMIKMVEPEEFVFSDIQAKINIEQREFMSRKFLIESSTDTLKWKITGNQKNILDYNCLEAELVGSSKKIVAWFAPTIPVSTGPDGFCGLPGLILAVDVEEGKTTIVATKIDLQAIDPKEIAKPKEGKKISKKEFDKIVEEKTKEMQNSGGGVFIIRQEN